MASSERNWLQFRQVDVFTDKPYSGNPLAVVLNADHLTKHQMQKIAQEMNLSETSFVTTPTQSDADYRIRIFTPTRELSFAGHPSIGTAQVLITEGLIKIHGRSNTIIRQEVGIGVLPLEIFSNQGSHPHIIMTQGTPQYYQAFKDSEMFASALGISENEIKVTGLVPQIVSTGLRQLIIPIGFLKTIARMTPNMAKLSQLEKDLSFTGCSVFSLETHSAETLAHVRFFAPGAGVPEDPATGSAAGALGAYLLNQGILDTNQNPVNFTLEQGEELGRPSRIHVEVSHNGKTATKIRVGGTALTIAKGSILV